MDLAVSSTPRRVALAGGAAALLLTSSVPAFAKAAPAPHRAGRSKAQMFTPHAEVSWFTIHSNGKRIGLGRSEYGKGEAVEHQFQNLLLMNMRAYRVAERSWWEFTSTLKPANFFQKTIVWKGGQSVTNTVDGVFDYQARKLKLDYREFGSQETLDVAVPGDQVSRNTQSLVLARERLAVGRQLAFKVYSLKERRFVQQRVRVGSYDAQLRAWVLEMSSEEAPGSVIRLWFQTATTAHPNGWTLKTSGPGPDKTTIELTSCSREQAIKGFEKEAESLGI